MPIELFARVHFLLGVAICTIGVGELEGGQRFSFFLEGWVKGEEFVLWCENEWGTCNLNGDGRLAGIACMRVSFEALMTDRLWRMDGPAMKTDAFLICTLLHLERDGMFLQYLLYCNASLSMNVTTSGVINIARKF